MQVWYILSSLTQKSFDEVLNKLLKKDDESATHLLAKISHLVDYGGHPSPPTAKPLKGLEGQLNEICHQFNTDELLRIYYFVDRDRQRMVLLNTTIKPNGRKYPSQFEGKKRKSMEKQIQKDIQTALSLKTKYLTSQNDYEQLII